MFTQPIGNFPAYTTTVRPTANTVVSGAVNNAANAYDSNPATYADFQTAVWTVQTVPGGVIGSPTIYVSYSASMEYIGPPGNRTFTIELSTDGGSTYPYSLYNKTGANSTLNETDTASVFISGSVNLANLKWRVTSSYTGGYIVSNKIYDVRVVY